MYQGKWANEEVEANDILNHGSQVVLQGRAKMRWLQCGCKIDDRKFKRDWCDSDTLLYGIGLMDAVSERNRGTGTAGVFVVSTFLSSVSPSMGTRLPWG